MVVVIVIVSFSFCGSSFHKCKQWGINPLLSTLNSMHANNNQYKVHCNVHSTIHELPALTV